MGVWARAQVFVHQPPYEEGARVVVGKSRKPSTRIHSLRLSHRALALAFGGDRGSEDKLKIEAKISEHPGGWTAVLGKIQLQAWAFSSLNRESRLNRHHSRLVLRRERSWTS